MTKIINVTNHPITFYWPETGERHQVQPHGKSLRATLVRSVDSVHRSGAEIYTFDYLPNQEGRSLVDALIEENPDAVLVGSVVAAQAYLGDVYGIIPVNGSENLPPAERVFYGDRFSTFRN